MDTHTTALYRLHMLNRYYFESMLMLIVVLWLIKWLFAYNPAICLE